MPFAGMAVNRPWAEQNADLLKRFLAAYTKGVAWFNDPQNHEAAVKIQTDISPISQDDVEKAYAFLHDKNLFEATGAVSRRKVAAVIEALRQLGDVSGDPSADHFLLPGVTQISE
jgi:NitT/TauT family transport system substrate-binding protein